jgi:hypothetical protein
MPGDRTEIYRRVVGPAANSRASSAAEVGRSYRIARAIAPAGIDSFDARTASARTLVVRLLPVAALVGTVVAAGVLALVYAVKATHWAVMTDELQTAKLASSIAETLSPVPHIHGVYYGALSQLYPLLMSPFFGALRPPAAATPVHALNAFLLASAAVPAYLLARSITDSRLGAIVAAAMTAFTPWLVLASTLLTENAAYPAFVWSVFLCHRTIARPSVAADAAACGGLILAFLARTEMVVLASALPVALLGHELAFALARAESRRRAAATRRALRRTVSGHGVLVLAYSIAGAAAVVLATRGSLAAVVGTYADVFHGHLVPSGLWSSAATHFDHVVTGVGAVPFLLATAWAPAAVIRPDGKRAHAFAVLLMVVVPMLTLEVTAFDLRFAGRQFEQDRYLFYVVPLFAVGAVAAVLQRTHVIPRIVLLVAAAGAFVGIDALSSYRRAVIFWASPVGAFHPTLTAAAHALGLSAGAFVRLSVLALAAALAAALALGARRATLCAVGLAVAGFGGFQAGWVFHRYVVPSLTVRATVAHREWIDAAARSASVALVPSPWAPPAAWWEAEFWNRAVDRVLRVGTGATYTPFPADRVDVDFAHGALHGPSRNLLVLARGETRFGLAHAKRLARTTSLTLVRVERPYRLAWATRGAAADGWIPAHRHATIRVYAGDRPLRRVLRVTTTAPIPAAKSHMFTFGVGRARERVLLGPGGRIGVRLIACVPAHASSDATVAAGFATRLPDGDVVALHLDKIEVRPAAAAESCGSIAKEGG